MGMRLYYKNKKGIMFMEVKTLKFEWKELDTIFEEILNKILNKKIACSVSADEYDYWAVSFVDYRMPIEEIKKVCDFIKATQDDMEEAFPSEGEEKSRDLGMGVSEKLISQYLNTAWKKTFADDDGLYLIDCSSVV